MAATIAGVTAAWLVIWSFLSGGILDRYARAAADPDARVLCRLRRRTSGAFSAWACSRWLIYAWLFGCVHAWIFEDCLSVG